MVYPKNKVSKPIDTNYHNNDWLSMETLDLSKCYSNFESWRAPNDNRSQSSSDFSGKRLRTIWKERVQAELSCKKTPSRGALHRRDLWKGCPIDDKECIGGIAEGGIRTNKNIYYRGWRKRKFPPRLRHQRCENLKIPWCLFQEQLVALP